MCARVCVWVPPHHPQKMKSSSTWKTSLVHIKSKPNLLTSLFLQPRAGYTLEKKSRLYSQNKGTHSHTFFPHLCGFFSEQISIFQPQIIPNIYVQSQAFKHSGLCGRLILTVLPTFNLGFFFSTSLRLTHSTIKVFKSSEMGGIKKYGGKYNLLITHCICWHAILYAL